MARRSELYLSPSRSERRQESVFASKEIRTGKAHKLENAFRNWWDSPFNSNNVYYYDSGIFQQVGMHLIGLASTPITYPFWVAGGLGKIVMGAAHRDGYEVEEGLKMIVAPVTSLATVVYGIATGLAKTATLPLRVAVGNEK